MATNIFNVSNGNWSDPTKWSLGHVPLNTEDVQIASPRTCTLDTNAAVALTVVFQTGSTFTVDPTVSATKLLVQNTINAVSTGNLGKVFIDMSANPANKCEIRWNNAGVTGAGAQFGIYGDWSFKGASKSVYAFTTAALTGQSTTLVEVDDITGWRVGDKIVFATTQAFSANDETLNIPLTISSATWSGGFLTVTMPSTSMLYKGMEICIVNVQTNMNGLAWPVYDVPSGTTFRIQMADPSPITDMTGNAYLLPRVDTVTIDSITPTTGTKGIITWSDGKGAGGAVAHDHATGCLTGNFTRNLIFGAGSAYGAVVMVLGSGSSGTAPRMDYCMFDRIAGSTGFPNGIITGNNVQNWQSLSYCAFYDCISQGSGGTVTGYPLNNGLVAAPARVSNLFYMDGRGASVGVGPACYGVNFSGQSNEIGPETNPIIFRASRGISLNWPGAQVINPWVSGCGYYAGGGLEPLSNDPSLTSISGGAVWSCRNGINSGQGNISAPPLMDSVLLGQGPTSGKYPAALNRNDINLNGNFGVVLQNCIEPAGGQVISFIAGALPKVKWVNKNANPAVQEVYQQSQYTTPSESRDTGTINRSTSSLKFAWANTLNDKRSEPFQILTKSGVPITLIGFFQKNANYGASTLPYVEISGLGITPVRITMSGGTAAGSWEKFSFLPATATEVVQNTGADGLLTVTFVGQSAVNGAACYFSGVPLAPFVSRCRHYGYLFDETIPTRTANITVSASEATAAAYTGMTVTWGASVSPVTLTADQTFQKLYDYTQAQACLNVGSAVPLTGAGVAGNPALFAAASITVNTGKKLNGSGTLAMGSFTLSAEFPANGKAYTYTGGTWSQASTVPAFSGGTLALGTEDTYTFTAADPIITFAPSANGVTYSLGGGTYTGTLDLRNTHATRAITVELPAGVSYTTASNTGAAITVSTPSLYQSVTVNGAVAGSRLQIYDTTHGTELYNGTPAFPYTWTDPTPAASSRAIRVRLAYVNGVTAKDFLEASIGTCGTTSGTKDISYLASQSDDSSYNTNAVDGSTVADITIDDSTDRVKINIAGGGEKPWPEIYAYQCYWNFTHDGIQDDGNIMLSPDPANYRVIGFKIKNLDMVNPLVLTDGYGVDATTGKYIDIIDTSGGFIFPDVEHVVSKVVTVGGVNVITGDIADVPTAAQNAAANWQRVLEAGLTAEQIIRIMASALAGKVSGAGTGAETFKGLDGSTDRIQNITDPDGNRLSVTVNGA